MQPIPPIMPSTKCRDFSHTRPPKTFSQPRPATRSASEAVQAILDTLAELQGKPDEQNLRRLKFWTKKIVSDILDYCNRTDFPDALIFTAASLLDSYIQRTKVDEETGSSIPLKRVKQDDTEFEFAVDNVDLNAWLSGLDISSIKAQLNIYRRVRAW